jgi:DNA-binding CsgD family transcriptional regulator
MIELPHRGHPVTAEGLSPDWDPVLELIAPGRSKGAAVLVVGDPGMGKSALLHAAVRLGRSTGYLIVPSSACRDDEEEVEREVDREKAAGIREWLGRASRRQPVLVAVDDADRIDPGGVETLLWLIETLRARPVVFVLTAGPRAARRLVRPGLAHHRLHPLSTSAAAQLLRRRPMSVSGRTADEVLRRAKGNPRALVELCHAFGAGDAPETEQICARYSRRIAALPPATRRAVLYAAGRVGREPLAAVLEAAGQTTLHPQVWKAAVAAGLVELGGTDVVFPDPLVAVAVYHSATAVERHRLHDDFAGAHGPSSFEGAMHRAMLPLAGDAPTAELLEAEIWKAREQGRMTQAAIAAQRAAELSTDRTRAARRYVLATLTASAAGDAGWTRELAAQVDRLTEAPDLRGSTASAVAISLSRAGHQYEAMDLLVRTARSHPPADRTTALGLAVCAAVVAVQSGSKRHLDAARALLATVAGLPSLPVPAPYLGHADHAVQRAFAAVSVDPSCGQEHRDLLPAGPGEAERMPAVDRLSLATIADTLGAGELATALRSEVLGGARPDGRIACFPEDWPPMVRGLIDTGRWRCAENALDTADELAATKELPVLRVHLMALRAILAALRGDAAAARSLVEESWPKFALDANRTAHVWLLRALGHAGLAAGDFEAASRNFLAAIAIEARSRPVPSDGVDVIGLAMAAGRAGTAGVALSVLNSIREAGGSGTSIRTKLQLAQAYALLIDDADTERRFRFAIFHPEAGRWPVPRALAQLHYGGWLRRRRRPLDARPQLSDARAAFVRVGAQGFARAAGVELRASGGAVEEPGGVALLSAQQFQIARLAAQGLRDREVADRLQLSPRTVSTHLRNVYLRLGITKRHELRQVLPPERPSA